MIWIPSGNLLQFAIENSHRNSGFTYPLKIVNFHTIHIAWLVVDLPPDKNESQLG